MTTLRFFVLLALAASTLCQAQSPQLTAVNANGGFARDKPIEWTVAVVALEKIRPVITRPVDFEAFEKTVITPIEAAPANAVDFAPRVRVTVLVGLGLIDTTCPPSGIFAMFNQLAGLTEFVIFSTLGHKGPHSTYDVHSKAWIKGLASNGPVAPKS